jgi:hypothetical protein
VGRGGSNLGFEDMGAASSRGAEVALVGREEDGAGVRRADGEKFRGVSVAFGTNGGLDIEGSGAEEFVLEAVEGADTLDTGGATLRGVVG